MAVTGFPWRRLRRGRTARLLGALLVAAGALALPAAGLAQVRARASGEPEPPAAVRRAPQRASDVVSPPAAVRRAPQRASDVVNPQAAAGPAGVEPAYLDPRLRTALADDAAGLEVIVLFGDPDSSSGGVHSAQAPLASQLAGATDAAARKAAFLRWSPRPMAFLAGLVRQGKAADLRPLWVINGAAVRAGAGAVLQMRNQEGVRAVMADQSFPAPPSPVSTASVDPWNLDAVNAPQAWQALGVSGDGVTVAVLDTGVDYHHPALREKFVGYRRPLPDNAGTWWCPRELCGDAPLYPADFSGHGTHVLGTILGDGVGVAPGARWIGAVVCTREECSDRWIYEALGWLLEEEPPRADVINMSLERRGSTDWVMKDAIDAAVAAGVVVVAASGNSGQVFSPGSFTSTVTVGAFDEEGTVPLWSGRGLSPWFERKPDVVAPGVGVVSSVPGGGYGTDTGTSMATPHVAGVAALMLEADPSLTPGDVRDLLHATSTSHGAVPAPDSGWGAVNAYGAVSALLDVATLEGFVLSTTGSPTRWAAAVSAERMDGTPVTRADADPDGAYRMAVAPGQMIVTASAFGYEAVTTTLALAGSEVRRTDFPLPPRKDGGWIVGRVTDAAGLQVDGRVLLTGTPVTSSLRSGYFALEGIPPGAYTVRVESPGHKIGTAAVELAAGGTEQVDIVLEAAPRILLVDGDAWRFSGAAAYYAASLETLGYLHDTWRVLDPTGGRVPTADELAAYEIVIWSHDVSSPGYVRAAANLDAYLQRGGLLVLAGQDVICTDSGSPPCSAPEGRQPYVSDRLLTRFLADTAASTAVRGSPGGPLAGLSFTLGGGDSLDNNLAPDVLGVLDGLRAEVVAEYGDGEGAVTFAATCLGYRAFVLGFGLEGIAEAADRDALLGRLIDALAAPDAERLVADAETPWLLAEAGASADYTVTLFNTGPIAVDITPSVTSRWPAQLMAAGFAGPLEGTVQAASCREIPFGVRVSVPATAGRAISDTAQVLVAAGSLSDTVDLVTRTPAPVLLVDGDSFYDSDRAYRDALDQIGVKYDVWQIAPEIPNGQARIPPPLATLRLYPAIVWFSGYNPFPTGQLTPESEEDLAQYLEGGGRLMFSSEDYLDYRGASYIRDGTLFREEFLGVAEYVQNFGVENVSGVEGTAFEHVASCPLRPSGSSQAEYFGDRLYPRPRALGALVGRQGQIVATQYYSGPFKSAFLSFDAGNLTSSCMPDTLRGALDWFSLVFPSSLAADRTSYASGDTVALDGTIGNDGPRATLVRAVWTIPPGATLVGAPPGWAWDGAAGTATWTGILEPSSRRDFGANLILDADIAPGTGMTSRLSVTDGDGLVVVRDASWRVNVADLETSAKTAALPPGAPALAKGQSARFTIAVRNRGSLDVPRFVVTDTLPSGLVLLERTITRPPGTTIVSQDSRGLVWSGSVARGGEVSLSYDAEVVTVQGGTLRNTAVIDPDPGDPIVRYASVLVKPNLLLPWIANKATLPRR